MIIRSLNQSIIAFTLLIVAVSGASATAEKPSMEAMMGIMAEDKYTGPIDAPVKMISYDALSCHHCAEFNTHILPALKEKYKSQVIFIHRDYPMDASSLYASVFLKCIAMSNEDGLSNRVDKFRALLFQTQTKWAFKANMKSVLNGIYDVVKFGGVERSTFDKCINNKQIQEAVVQDKILAIDVMKVQATPTHFINGKKHEGMGSVEYFSEMIDLALTSQNKKRKANDAA